MLREELQQVRNIATQEALRVAISAVADLKKELEASITKIQAEINEKLKDLDFMASEKRGTKSK